MKPMTWLLLVAPLVVFAQAVPTEFPSGAVPIEPEALRQRLTGKTFMVKPAAGPEFRIEYKTSHAYLNVYFPGRTSADSGPWRVQGSTACIDWQQATSGCSEYRLVGDTLYTKRVSNGEVVRMQPD